MKFKLLALAGLMASSVTFAQDNALKRNWEESTGISKIYMGFTNDAMNFGLSHERRKGALGWDLLGVYSSDNGDNNTIAQKNEQLMIGSAMIFHLQDNSPADVYFGTGVQVMQHSDVTISGEESDETSFGPLFKIGSSYYFNNDWSLGLEYMIAQNWHNDDVPAQQSYGFLNLGYTY